MFKKIITLFSVSLFIFLSFGVNVSAQEEGRYTIDSYQEFLMKEDRDAYKKFIALDPEQKQIFLNYINNPKKMLEDVGREGSPIQVSIKTEEKNFGYSGFRSSESLQYKNISQTYTQSLFGIDYLIIVAELKYSHDNSSIRDIISYDTYVDRNFTGILNQFIINNKHAYKVGNQLVKYVSKVTLKLAHEKFGIEVATKELGVAGGLHGKVQGWFK